jgi:hypothetical protein
MEENIMEHIVCQTCHSPIPATLYDEHIKTHQQDPRTEIHEAVNVVQVVEPIQSDNIENPQDIPTQCGKCHAINGHMRDCPDFSQPISQDNSKEECVCVCHIRPNESPHPAERCLCHKEEIVHGEVVNPDTAIEKQGENRDAAGKFVPGVSGNPHGRPKREWTWATLIEDYADRKRKVKITVKGADGKEEKKDVEYSYRELVVKRLYDEAANGNIHALKEIMNRMDGMPNQTIGNQPGKNGQVEAFIVRNTNYANAIDEEVAPALAEGTKDGGDTGDTNSA